MGALVKKPVPQSVWVCERCGRKYESPIKGTDYVSHACPRDFKRGRRFEEEE